MCITSLHRNLPLCIVSLVGCTTVGNLYADLKQNNPVDPVAAFRAFAVSDCLLDNLISEFLVRSLGGQFGLGS